MKIYVGNLSYDAVEGDIEKAFGEFGKVDSVRILTDKETGTSKGVAFVEMAVVSEGQAAIKGLADKEFMGRGLKVAEAKEKPARSGGRGGFGGQSGGGGGHSGGSGRRFAGRGSSSDDNSGNRHSGNREARDGNRR